jgi:hypothetical protein
MKLTKQQIVNKVKNVNSEFTEAKLDLVLDTFFKVDIRPPLNSITFKAMREKSGLNFNAKYMAMEVDALILLGFELAPTQSEKTSKRYMISQAFKQVRATKSVVTKVYENLIDPHRRTADALSKRMPDLIGETSHPKTIKKIESIFESMGAKVKPVYIKTGGGNGFEKGKKFNNNVDVFDSFRWNPSQKMMPEAFKHLDNAW